MLMPLLLFAFDYAFRHVAVSRCHAMPRHASAAADAAIAMITFAADAMPSPCLLCCRRWLFFAAAFSFHAITASPYYAIIAAITLRLLLPCRRYC